MDEPIGAYLDDYTLLEQPGVSARLDDLVKTYPWFTLGRYMQLRSLRGVDPAGYHRALRRTDVRLFIHPYPTLLLAPVAEPAGEPAAVAVEVEEAYHGHTFETGFESPHHQPVPSETDAIIDDFLSTEGWGSRIVAEPPVPGVVEEPEDISVASVAEDGEIATEILAQIYLAQGLPDRAIEIYYKLGLKYPEKNAYFADLIAEIRAENGEFGNGAFF